MNKMDDEKLLLKIVQLVYNETNDWKKVDMAICGFCQDSPYDEDSRPLMLMCATYGWLKVLQWARSVPNPCPWEKWVLEEAIGGKNGFITFKWLLENDCPVYDCEFLVQRALEHNTTEFIDYIYDCQIPQPRLIVCAQISPRGRDWIAEHGENWRNGVFRCSVKPAKH